MSPELLERRALAALQPLRARAHHYIRAARVPLTVAPQEFGLWAIRRRYVMDGMTPEARAMFKLMLGGFDHQTVLHRMTEEKMHRTPEGWEVVMEDSAQELRQHLPIWIHGHGRILVTGLGLGCVVRGLLAKPSVSMIDVVELDAAILRIIGAEFEHNPRVRLHHGDALTLEWSPGTAWDFAWHDLWVEGDGLQALHAKLFYRFRDMTPRQGAWAFPRRLKRALPAQFLR